MHIKYKLDKNKFNKLIHYKEIILEMSTFYLYPANEETCENAMQKNFKLSNIYQL